MSYYVCNKCSPAKLFLDLETLQRHDREIHMTDNPMRAALTDEARKIDPLTKMVAQTETETQEIESSLQEMSDPAVDGEFTPYLALLRTRIPRLQQLRPNRRTDGESYSLKHEIFSSVVSEHEPIIQEAETRLQSRDRAIMKALEDQEALRKRLERSRTKTEYFALLSGDEATPAVGLLRQRLDKLGRRIDERASELKKHLKEAEIMRGELHSFKRALSALKEEQSTS